MNMGTFFENQFIQQELAAKNRISGVPNFLCTAILWRFLSCCNGKCEYLKIDMIALAIIFLGKKIIPSSSGGWDMGIWKKYWTFFNSFDLPNLYLYFVFLWFVIWDFWMLHLLNISMMGGSGENVSFIKKSTVFTNKFGYLFWREKKIFDKIWLSYSQKA